MATEQDVNYELCDPPTDGISSVQFSPTDSPFLLVSSWDNVGFYYPFVGVKMKPHESNDLRCDIFWQSVRLYDVTANQQRLKFEHKAAVLDCCFSDGAHGFSGGLDKRVKMLDFNTSNDTVLGTHDDTVKCLVWSKEANQLITGSWDRTIRLWDPRAAEPQLGKYNQPAKIFSMDVTHNKLVVAMAGRHVFIYDIRNMTETLQCRESSLKFMTRCVRAMPNGEGYASSSIEGRIAVEFFDPSSDTQARKYAFKCHRQNIDGVDTVYPVNTLAFHPIHGTFVSGGADGIVSVWDGWNKKRLRQYPRYPTSIASLAFSHDGRMLAVASSYTFEEGEKDHAPDSVYIKYIGENEFRPKQKE